MYQCVDGDLDLILLRFVVEAAEASDVRYRDRSIPLTTPVQHQWTVGIPLILAICSCCSSCPIATFRIAHSRNPSIFGCFLKFFRASPNSPNDLFPFVHSRHSSERWDFAFVALATTFPSRSGSGAIRMLFPAGERLSSFLRQLCRTDNQPVIIS
jgi:hypothetical protein